MKLKIVGECLARVKVNMDKFKADFRNTLNLKESVRKNFSIIESKDKELFNDEILFRSVYNFLDWEKILNLINNVDEEFMEVRFYTCEYTDRIEVFPDSISEDGRDITLRQEQKTGSDIILVNNFVNSPDYDISCYLKSKYFNYGLNRWKAMINWR